MKTIPPEYAAIPNAYAFGEVICSTPDEDASGVTIFDLLRKSKWDMPKVLSMLREIAADSPEEVDPVIKQSILVQMNHPLWRTYVAAQLGMM